MIDDKHGARAVDAPIREALFAVAFAGGGESGLRERLNGALESHGIAALARLDASLLRQECGLSEAQARRVAAAFQLGRATEGARIGERPSLRRPAEVARLMQPVLRGLEVETFHALVLDARHRLKRRVEVSRGTLTMAPVHPREVFAPALRLAVGLAGCAAGWL
ncbi:MAG: JAB domain-containing protein, partial [Planctomycetota bacterium]